LRLYPDKFLDIELLCPPHEEQLSIVAFLGRQDRLIKRYIGAKRHEIRLLNEEKQAIIHRAVTRGLGPNVGLKPSGITWLGEIPQHWKVRKLKHLTRFVNGLPFKPSDWKDDGTPIIRIQNLNGSDVFNYPIAWTSLKHY
jgi:type I restriction enzyme S subunit